MLGHRMSVAGLSSRRTMDEIDEQVLTEYVRSMLKDGIPGLPDLTDLVSWWSLTPEDEMYSDNPEGLTSRDAMLYDYINESDHDLTAREELRRLLQVLFEKRENIPDLLVNWGLYQVARGHPPPRSGRRPETKRNLLVVMITHFLWSKGLSERASVRIIANALSTEETLFDQETVRSIFRKYPSVLPPW